jgi:polyphosphate glucokinase
MEKHGEKKRRRYVDDVVARLIAAIEPDDVVIGGGNVKELKEIPPRCRAGDNADEFAGGFRLWKRGRKRRVTTEASNGYFDGTLHTRFPVSGSQASRCP